jgi:hypothetical protein
VGLGVANPLQEFIDSQAGIVLSVSLHTLGAIALLGGLVGYLAWHRHLRHGHHHPAILQAAAFLTYIAIVANLVGGFMRTYETGHPSITQFNESAWVRALAIKHVFLFAAMGAAIVLFERIAPRLIRAFKEGTLTEPRPLGHRVGVVLVGLGILLAAILGAVTQVVPLVEAQPEPDLGHGGHGLVRYANATGQLTSTPLAPGAASGGFQVAEGTAQLAVTLQWSPATFDLTLRLVPPSGGAVDVAGSNGRAEQELVGPVAGSWSYTITSPLAVNAAWTLTVRMAEVPADETVLANRVTIAPGQFYEINMVADRNATLSWAWTTSAAVHFDLHTHFDDEVQYVVEEQTDASSGSYVVQRDGGHSYLWENTGTLPVTLDYRVWGDFELDSIFPA